MARYHAAEELHITAFLDACFSMLHMLLIKTLCCANKFNLHTNLPSVTRNFSDNPRIR